MLLLHLVSIAWKVYVALMEMVFGQQYPLGVDYVDLLQGLSDDIKGKSHKLNHLK